ncbi:hypothetical protein ACIRSU_17770 [Streptomyces sp. NPDC101160]|uniref:hypothetical protein n=1 Tax=Streptomyces sp. NPDC101160 TaxID=3366118 RepID=UPI00381992F2
MIVRGSGGAVLRHEDGVLLLRRGDEETRIPLEAVRRVSPGGRAVTVTLRVPEGAEPVVHVVQGVHDTPAYAFASAVGAALARLPEPGPSFDGARLVTTSSRNARAGADSDADDGPKRLLLGLISLGPGLAALVVMSVLLVMHGEAIMLALSVPLGVVAVVLNFVSAAATERGYAMWRLPRRGVTVTAERTSPSGATGTYAYTDQHGATHTYRRKGYASRIEVSYDPAAPTSKVGVYPVVVRLLVGLAALALWSATTGLIVLMIRMGIDGV